MNVLLLSPYPERIARVISATGDLAVAFNDRISVDRLHKDGIDFIISYGYRYLIRSDVIAACPGRIINLHISFLPWNRGSDPNFWSFFDATPKGVSIHRIDAGLDTGPILAQEEIVFAPGETLASSYEKLRHAVEALLAETWPSIRNGVQPVREQVGAATGHRSRDKDLFFARLLDGWDSPVGLVEDMGRCHRAKLSAMEMTEMGGR